MRTMTATKDKIEKAIEVFKGDLEANRGIVLAIKLHNAPDFNIAMLPLNQ